MQPMDGVATTSSDEPPRHRPRPLQRSSSSTSSDPSTTVSGAVRATSANNPTSSTATGAGAAVHAAMEGFLQNNDPPLSKLIQEHLLPHPDDLGFDDALRLLQPAVTTGTTADVLAPPVEEEDPVVSWRNIQWQACGRIWLWHQYYHHPSASSKKALVRQYVRRLCGLRTNKQMRRCKYSSDSWFESVVRVDVVTVLSRLAFGLGPRDPPFAVAMRDTLHPLLRLPSGRRRLQRSSGGGTAQVGEVDSQSDDCDARLHQFLQSICDSFELPLFVVTDQKSNDRTMEEVEAETKASAQRRKRQRRSRSSAASTVPILPIPSSDEEPTQPQDAAAALLPISSAAALSTLLIQPSSLLCRPTAPKGGNPLLQQQPRKSFVSNSHFRTNAAALWRQQVAVAVPVAPVGGKKPKRTSPFLSVRPPTRVSEVSVAESPVLHPPFSQQQQQHPPLPRGERIGGHCRKRTVFSPLHNRPTQISQRLILPHPKKRGLPVVPETPIVGGHPTQQREQRRIGDDDENPDANDDFPTRRGRGTARPMFLRYE